MVVSEQDVSLTLASPRLSRPAIATQADYAACRRVMRAASRNYSFASNFLPADRLPHVEALYALMRVGDDRVDVSHNGFASPLAAIEDWERTYWGAFEAGDSPDPIMRAYLDTALTFGIPADVMAPYFRAMREDLTIRRFLTFADLMHYMDGSAIPVGRAMTHILGTHSPYTVQDALPGADALSVGMQLSNFWRDIGEDYQKNNRIYIPQEDMDRFGVTERDIAEGRITSELIALLEFEFGRTEVYYATARQSIPMLATGRWGVMSGLLIYRAILAAIRRNGYDVFTQRASADTARKLGLVAWAWWLTR